MNRNEILKQTLPGVYVVDTTFSHVLWPRNHEHTPASGAILSSTRETLDSSSTRAPIVAVLVLLGTARAMSNTRAHEHE